MHVIGVIHLNQLANTTDAAQSSAYLDKVTADIELLEHCHSVDKWILLARSPALEQLKTELAHKTQLSFVSTPERDALDTFYRAAVQQMSHSEIERHLQVPGQLVLRVTPGAEPLDAKAIETMLRNHLSEGFDYSSNNMLDDGPRPTIEIMNLQVLNEAWREALLPDDRELITPYITRQHQRLNLGCYKPEELSSRNIGTTYF